MYSSPQKQDAVVYIDTATIAATGNPIFSKTGLAYIDCASMGIGHLSFQTTGTYSVTDAFQVSNDLITFSSAPVQLVSTVPQGENTSVVGGAQALYEIPVRGWRYFRFNITAYVSGPWNVTVVGRAGSAVPATVQAQVGQDGTWTVQPGNTANTTAWLTSPAAFTTARVTADGQIRATAGKIHAITLSPLTATPTAGLITVYDSAAESGTVIFSEWFAATSPAHTVIIDGAVTTGIYVGYDGTAANIGVSVSHSA